MYYLFCLMKGGCGVCWCHTPQKTGQAVNDNCTSDGQQQCVGYGSKSLTLMTQMFDLLIYHEEEVLREDHLQLIRHFHFWAVERFNTVSCAKNVVCRGVSQIQMQSHNGNPDVGWMESLKQSGQKRHFSINFKKYAFSLSRVQVDCYHSHICAETGNKGNPLPAPLKAQLWTHYISFA